jgi:NitT/TauT family transport system ATP-binding protein
MPDQTIAIGFEKVSKVFGAERYTALDQVDLSVRTARFVSVVGPSGCGKSTLLNLAAGLDQPSKGSVTVHGEPLTGLNRRAAYMFQQDALLPWKTVLENVVLGLMFRGMETAEARRQALPRWNEWVSRILRRLSQPN